ncbi:MAG: NAD+ synthase, partial [Candidatus Melainabacteria bacterium]|nr:NAD+ synthase [Candidatus Melainabacteria bacterium]
HVDPIEKLCSQKIDLLINASASPYFIDKPKLRENILVQAAKKHKVPIVFVNQVGGNDELIFDGNSCVISKEGTICRKLQSFKEELDIFEFDLRNGVEYTSISQVQDSEEELFQALICGVKDYVTKCGFKKVIIGLSGGIDSALVAIIAKEALGKENVSCIFMPSRYTSKQSEDDAKKLASNIKVELKTISIEEPFLVFLKILSPYIQTDGTLTEENIQPRIRGLILMALSNQTGALVLSTGNKSELATGYCTLYGDMCGGLAVISDLPKTMVYKLATYINKKEKNELIPQNIITKAPTAELKPNQTDQDKLPPYEKLDKILNKYVEEHLPLKEIIKNGLSPDLVQSVCNMIDTSEYKREQAAPGLKLTSRSFGYGWRMPIAQKYREQI